METKCVCPNCGYCEHCGRGGYQRTYPWYPTYPTPYPWYPYYGTAVPDNTYRTWESTTICGSSPLGNSLTKLAEDTHEY